MTGINAQFQFVQENSEKTNVHQINVFKNIKKCLSYKGSNRKHNFIVNFGENNSSIISDCEHNLVIIHQENTLKKF